MSFEGDRRFMYKMGTSHQIILVVAGIMFVMFVMLNTKAKIGRSTVINLGKLNI